MATDERTNMDALVEHCGDENEPRGNNVSSLPATEQGAHFSQKDVNNFIVTASPLQDATNVATPLRRVLDEREPEEEEDEDPFNFEEFKMNLSLTSQTRSSLSSTYTSDSEDNDESISAEIENYQDQIKQLQQDGKQLHGFYVNKCESLKTLTAEHAALKAQFESQGDALKEAIRKQDETHAACLKQAEELNTLRTEIEAMKKTRKREHEQFALADSPAETVPGTLQALEVSKANTIQSPVSTILKLTHETKEFFECRKNATDKLTESNKRLQEEVNDLTQQLHAAVAKSETSSQANECTQTDCVEQSACLTLKKSEQCQTDGEMESGGAERADMHGLVTSLKEKVAELENGRQDEIIERLRAELKIVESQKVEMEEFFESERSAMMEEMTELEHKIQNASQLDGNTETKLASQNEQLAILKDTVRSLNERIMDMEQNGALLTVQLGQERELVIRQEECIAELKASQREEVERAMRDNSSALIQSENIRSAMERELSALRAEVKHVTIENKELGDQLSTSDEQVSKLESTKTKLEEKLEKYEEFHYEAEAKYKKSETEKENLRKDIAALTEKMATTNVEASADSRENIERWKQEKTKMEKKLLMMCQMLERERARNFVQIGLSGAEKKECSLQALQLIQRQSELERSRIIKRVQRLADRAIAKLTLKDVDFSSEDMVKLLTSMSSKLEQASPEKK
jgi:chromosome segregation ATPase